MPNPSARTEQLALVGCFFYLTALTAASIERIFGGFWWLIAFVPFLLIWGILEAIWRKNRRDK